VKKEDRDVARHELIGLSVSIGSRHAGFEGVFGTVVDETKNTLLVERTSGPETAVPKKGNRFVFRVGNERFVVSGEDIQFRPEDRTKKVRG